MKFPITDQDAKRVLIKEYPNELGKICLYAVPSWPCYEKGFMNWHLEAILVPFYGPEFRIQEPTNET